MPEAKSRIHRGEVKPIYVIDTERCLQLVTTVRRVVGYRAHCKTCDWWGRKRYTYSGAIFDKSQHEDRA